MIKKAVFLLFLFLSPFQLHAATLSTEPLQNLHFKVLETVKHSQEIPDHLKSKTIKIWNQLVQNGVVEVSGRDKDIRPYFVTLQAVIEHVLSCELQREIKSLDGIIHTPLPATPLCTAGEISRGLVDASIENDFHRLFTVKLRSTTIRDFLYQGGHLQIVYPSGGLAKRATVQQVLYKQELLNYPDRLLDQPLSCDSIPENLIGATYLFKTQAGQTFAFAIKMTQANDPKEKGNFGLWFGPLEIEAIKNRVDAVLSFIEQNRQS